MIPTAFITREWARTRIHEGQVYIFPEADKPKTFVSRSCRADSVSYSVYASFLTDADIGEMLFGKKTYGKKFHGLFIGRERTYRVIYMDDAWVCPFCGSVDLHREWEDGDERESQWRALPRGHDLSEGELAIVEAVAKLNEQTPEFRFRMCERCRQFHRRPILSRNPPEYEHELRWDSLPYERLAVSIADENDRVAWWETKLICHRKRLETASAPCVKKAIERRLRRKNLTQAEHEALCLMLAASSIKKLLKTA